MSSGSQRDVTWGAKVAAEPCNNQKKKKKEPQRAFSLFPCQRFFKEWAVVNVTSYYLTLCTC